jgi:hypothetical protein
LFRCGKTKIDRLYFRRPVRGLTTALGSNVARFSNQ